MSFENDLEAVHTLLKEAIRQREKRAAFQATSLKIFESMQETSREATKWIDETFKPEPVTPATEREEVIARSDRFMQDHLAKLKQQTDALRRWRDSI